MIQAHKGYKQICLLIDRLENVYTDLYVHIDKKNDELFNKLVDTYIHKNNVLIIKERVNVNWSGFSQVQATLNMIKSVVNSNKNYSYVSLISGQDLPIKSNEYIYDLLIKAEDKEFIECNDIGKYAWRLKCYNFFTENVKNRTLLIKIIDNLTRYTQKMILRRNNFKGMELYCGSQWFTLTYDCIKYMHNHLEKNTDYLENFKYSSCSDEHFFQILIMNSKYRNKVQNNNLRYIDWSEQESSPKILDFNYRDKILVNQAISARKFDIDVDEKIIASILNMDFM